MQNYRFWPLQGYHSLGRSDRGIASLHFAVIAIAVLMQIMYCYNIAVKALERVLTSPCRDSIQLHYILDSLSYYCPANMFQW